MRLGCHAVMFAKSIAENPDKVLSQIAQTGFQGVEIGSRFFGTDRRNELTELLQKYGLELASLHALTSLCDLADKKEEAFAKLLPAVEFASQMKYRNISLTGMRGDAGATSSDPRLSDPEFVARVAEGLDYLAVESKKNGVTVNYHNHFWEFENDALIYRTILVRSPNVNFAFDTGWAFFAGYDPVELMEKNPERFKYAHIRDFNRELGEFVNLGEGDSDLLRLTKTMAKMFGPDDWAIVEYETGAVNYKRYRTAYIYLQHILDI